MKGVGGISALKPPRKTQFPRPPRAIAAAKKVGHRTGPGDPPGWFLSATTSLSEWYIYWAFLKVKGKPGETSWGYQIDAGGGRGAAGGAVIDFVVWDQEPRLAIRIQTDRCHIATTARTQQYDERSKRMLERLGYKVIDIYENNFIHDKSGKTAIKKVRMAINGLQDPSPITAPVSFARPGRV